MNSNREQDMKLSTKEKIVYESLRLFSERGYNGVSMREIAAAVNIKAASLYVHFKGKDAIYHAIGETMKARYDKEMKILSMDGQNPAADAWMYQKISYEQLYAIGKELFLYFVHDEYTRMYRKMITIGQFENEVLAQEYSKQYYDDAIAYQKQLFAMLAGDGNIFRSDVDYEVMAVHFYTPIYTFITICDRQPEREKEMVELLGKHIAQFVELYTTY